MRNSWADQKASTLRAVKNICHLRLKRGRICQELVSGRCATADKAGLDSAVFGMQNSATGRGARFRSLERNTFPQPEFLLYYVEPHRFPELGPPFRFGPTFLHRAELFRLAGAVFNQRLVNRVFKPTCAWSVAIYRILIIEHGRRDQQDESPEN